MDLLEVAGKQPSLPIVICCSSRDELDAVCSTVANLSYISFSPLVNKQLTFLRYLTVSRRDCYGVNQGKFDGFQL